MTRSRRALASASLAVACFLSIIAILNKVVVVNTPFSKKNEGFFFARREKTSLSSLDYMKDNFTHHSFIVPEALNGVGGESKKILSFDDDDNAADLSPTLLPSVPAVQVSRIVLLGERHSGTNYITSVLKKAFFPKYVNLTCGGDSSSSTETTNKVYSFPSCIPVLKFKHMFRHFPLNSTELGVIQERLDILWILAVRHPCKWAYGMYLRPWHMCPLDDPSVCPGPNIRAMDLGSRPYSIGKRTRAEFFRAPWADKKESNYSPNRNDFTYKNVFDLRRHKLSLMKQIIDVVPHNVKIVNLDVFAKNPDGFVQEVKSQFRLKVNRNYTRNPERPSTVKSTTSKNFFCLNKEEWKITQEEIDWNMEGHFGFNRLDCYICRRDFGMRR